MFDSYIQMTVDQFKSLSPYLVFLLMITLGGMYGKHVYDNVEEVRTVTDKAKMIMEDIVPKQSKLNAKNSHMKEVTFDTSSVDDRVMLL
jgi:hypothetical protein